MSRHNFRFVHASNLRLDRPLGGIAEIPSQLRDVFVDAPFRAAERVVTTALDENADALILVGDVLSATRAGPREILLLAEQFERLADRQIPVYWVPGESDPDEQWTSISLLPDNVRLFPRGAQASVVLERQKKQLARFVSLGSRDLEISLPSEASEDGLFCIAAQNGTREPRDPQDVVDYWALGGRYQSTTATAVAATIHDPGSPQGRRPAETGPHSCTVVDVDTSHGVELTPVQTDVVRWHHERLEMDPSMDAIQLELQMRERLQRLMVDQPDRHLLISWTISGGGTLTGGLRRGVLAEDLVAKLRAEFGHQSPALWTVQLTVAPAHAFPGDWYEEETILGEFLRNVQRLESKTPDGIDLNSYLRSFPADVKDRLEIRDKATYEDLLRRAAALGADMLRGETAQLTDRVESHSGPLYQFLVLDALRS